MKSLSNVTAVILFMFGSAWVLAGLNLIGDTSMSGERLWAESIEAFLENVGQGTPSKGAFPRDDRSTTHNPAKILLDAPRAHELSARSKRAEARELHGGCASSSA